MDSNLVAWISLGVIVILQMFAWVRDSARTGEVLKHLRQKTRDHENRLRHIEGRRALPDGEEGS